MQAIARLVDEMIPGDGEFPSASSLGVHGVLVHRLRTLDGPDAYANLLKRLESNDADAIAANDPEFFAKLRMITYLAYYEQPAVIAVIRGMGFTYNDAPLPLGYEQAPFDPATDLPDVKGHYMPTSAFDEAGGKA